MGCWEPILPIHLCCFGGICLPAAVSSSQWPHAAPRCQSSPQRLDQASKAVSEGESEAWGCSVIPQGSAVGKLIFPLVRASNIRGLPAASSPLTAARMWRAVKRPESQACPKNTLPGEQEEEPTPFLRTPNHPSLSAMLAEFPARSGPAEHCCMGAHTNAASHQQRQKGPGADTAHLASNEFSRGFPTRELPRPPPSPPQGPLPGVLMQSHHWERAEDEEEEAGLSRGSCAEIKGTKASHPKLQENLIIKDKTPSVCVDCDLMLAPGFNSS